ncbi:AVAST type 1 anti-phage system protein Avs1c [Sphingobacterium sp. MYb388]|uniref:AVAST type 1 anti-phage system protein Avs1c n=1 Tax=Sphingobacterium sp. MYb388 TaxID=2745437 RepID=UPI00403F7D32
MISPNNRKEFERRISLLAERIKDGKFHIPPDPRLINGLLNVRIMPNRRTNFLTINESTRLLANSIANFERPEFKSKKDADQ